jgi:outer membrane cobalamin receptor
MKALYALLPAFFIFQFAIAQQATIKGKVIDADTKESIIGANVVLPGGTGAATSIDGDYEIKVDAGTYSIVYRFIGYANKTVSVTVGAGETKTINVSLAVESNQLNAVVVSAGKHEQKLSDVTVSMEVIKPGLIESKSTVNCQTILEQVPGVSITDEQVSIRGGSGFAYGAGSRVLLMVDDLPLLAADAGDVKWNTLPIENIEQIEVIKGASSVLFGSSALNGAINIRTGYPKAEPETRINLLHGVYNSPVRPEIEWWDSNPYYTGASFFHSRRVKENFDLTVGGAFFSDQGYREGETEHRGRMNFNTRYRSKKVEGLSYGLNMNAQYSEGGLFLIWENDSNVYRPFGGADSEDPGSTISDYQTSRVNFDPYITYYNKKGNKHNLRTRFYRTNNRNNTNQGSLADLYYAEYQYQKSFKDSTLKLTSGMVTTYSEITADLYGDHFGSNFAIFSQLDKKFDRLNLSLGVRGEYFKLDTAETVSNFELKTGSDTITFPIQPVFRAGANYRAFEETYFRASFGQGYRYPSIAEKYVSTAVGLLNIFPNPSIQPETGWSAELAVKQGFKLGSWKGYLDIAGFWTEYKNMMEFTFGMYNPDSIPLTFDPNAEGYALNWAGFRAENAERAKITGIDISVIAKGKIGALDATFYGGYTYMNPVSFNNDPEYLETFSDTNSTMLKYRFRHLAKADFQLDYKRFSMGFSARYNSFMENIDKAFLDLNVAGLPLGDFIVPGLPEYREERNKGDIVFDHRVSYQMTDNSKLAVITNNVLNREYMTRPGDVQPPRTVIVQYTLNF